ncbi:cyanophycin metabolism-associated DUF1854 family protein [Pollutimonas bauzanensis]|uniref:DUF1854 domain-containing protein n=1 Tax=Pollutimonas bauzanensis TaxID=658167 RepID=A0A1M5Y5U8_9BURK|nr:DUF1854 domain-containing protein [Pollutimonas bauzanensis]SHI07427.1 protein of unknown function [Pollutimonas bauzanensis]
MKQAAQTTMHPQDFRLSRDPYGRLVLGIAGRVYDTIVPVRSFPISAPDEGIALVGADGSELVWIDSLADLPEDIRRLVEDELASREFMPEIRRIRHASSFATPSRWQVETDRGEAVLLLKAEEDIRRLSGSTLLIADAHGVQYLVRDVAALDKASRRMLDHFL